MEDLTSEAVVQSLANSKFYKKTIISLNTLVQSIISNNWIGESNYL